MAISGDFNHVTLANTLVLPQYKPHVQWPPVTTRTVRRWSLEAHETMRGCFEATDWEVLTEPDGEDIKGTSWLVS